MRKTIRKYFCYSSLIINKEQTPFQKVPNVRERKQDVTKVVSLEINGGKSGKRIKPPKLVLVRKISCFFQISFRFRIYFTVSDRISGRF